jgi:AraC-like DNA-binding protein
MAITSTELTTVSAYLEAIIRALEAAGVDADALLHGLNIERARGNDPLQRIGNATINTIYARCVAATGDEYFGLRVAGFIVPGMLHALGYALLASETLEDFCHRFMRYYALVTQSAQLGVRIDGDEFLFTADPRNPALCVETQDAWVGLLMRLMRGVWSGELPLRELELRRPCPAGGAGPFIDYFACPVHFGREHNCFHFDLAVMREPLLGANRELAQHNDRISMAYLEKLDRDDIVNRVRAQLAHGLGKGVFSRSGVAALLHMSPSTLQAKLARRGVSFQELLDGMRHELAMAYVTQSRLSITEIAIMLGFSNVSNFNRAFRRWTGKAPSEYRLAAQ